MSLLALPPQFIVTSAIFFAAGLVKGVLGMGLPTMAMGLLGLLMPVSSAAALLTAPSLVTNVWQAFSGPLLKAMLRRLWLMQLGIALGVAATPMLLPATPEAFGQRLLGLCLLAYGSLALWRRSLLSITGPHEAWWGLVVGLTTGVITGLTGVFVLPAVPFLQALGLGKDGLSQALGVCFTTATLALVTVLAWQGHLGLQASTLSVILVVPALAGMYLGQLIRGRMSEAVFRRCFFTGLLLLGGCLALR